MAATLENVCNLVLKVVRAMPGINHVSQAKLRQFCTDLAIVTLGIRTGYLFDSFSLRGQRTTLLAFFSSLLKSLRQEHNVFSSTVIVHEPRSEQLFFVNLPLLQDLYGNSSTPSERISEALLSWTAFIEVRGSSSQVIQPPPTLIDLLLQVLTEAPDGEDLPILISISPTDDEISLGDMVSLAACLIEFPVAYIPTEGTGSGEVLLSGVPLSVYECTLVFDRQAKSKVQDHTLLKFSCPQEIVDTIPELLSGKLEERLRGRFGERLRQTGTLVQFVVRQNVQVLDRVAM